MWLWSLYISVDEYNWCLKKKKAEANAKPGELELSNHTLVVWIVFIVHGNCLPRSFLTRKVQRSLIFHIIKSTIFSPVTIFGDSKNNWTLMSFCYSFWAWQFFVICHFRAKLKYSTFVGLVLMSHQKCNISNVAMYFSYIESSMQMRCEQTQRKLRSFP